jgi:peptidyl-prolyl cis-trans isomerase SurA
MKCFIALFFLLTTLAGNAGADDGETLFTIDGDPVTVGEFEYIYNKNNFNNKADYSEKSLREYLELYINFRLKVKEAEALGLDEDAKLQSELKVYQEQLYKSFFDREKLRDLVDEAVERSAHDVLISHIFVGLSTGENNSETDPDRDIIEAAYRELEEGKPFEEVAMKYSQDKFTSKSGGELAYYTALQIAYYPLENAAYQTPVGAYSQPVRTAIGYHIIKVNDKRPARGMAKAAVIKLNKKKGDAGASVLSTIETIYSELKEGADFTEYARKYSQDAATRAKGGEMDWFGIARYDPRFEDAVFELANIGDISSPFETGDAWYIVKLLGRKDASGTEEDRDVISKKVKQSDRYKIAYSDHINNILDKHGFEYVQPGFNNFRDAYTLTPENLAIYLSSAVKDPVIARITGNEFRESDFGKFIADNTFRYQRMEAGERFDQLFEDFKNDKAVEFHIIEYGKENREYGALLNEYRDGILLFELMEKNVWSRAVEDTAGLRQFFFGNREKFLHSESAEVSVYTVGDSKKAAFLVKALESDPELKSISWLTKLNKKGISTEADQLEILATDDLADRINWAVGASQLETDGQWKVYQVTAIKEAKQRSFEDSKGFAIAEYQEYLEEIWISSLREKYKVVVNDAVLMGLVK